MWAFRLAVVVLSLDREVTDTAVAVRRWEGRGGREFLLVEDSSSEGDEEEDCEVGGEDASTPE